MKSDIRILEVVKDGDDGLIVTFSDGTIGGCVVEELLELRPIREKAAQPISRALRPAPATQV